MKHFIIILILILCLFIYIPSTSAQDYTVGPGDILEISILQPDRTVNQVTVSPDGNISVAYLGSVNVKGKTITQIQKNLFLVP